MATKIYPIRTEYFASSAGRVRDVFAPIAQRVSTFERASFMPGENDKNPAYRPANDAINRARETFRDLNGLFRNTADTVPFGDAVVTDPREEERLRREADRQAEQNSEDEPSIYGNPMTGRSYGDTNEDAGAFQPLRDGISSQITRIIWGVSGFGLIILGLIIARPLQAMAATQAIDVAGNIITEPGKAFARDIQAGAAVKQAGDGGSLAKSVKKLARDGVEIDAEKLANGMMRIQGSKGGKASGAARRSGLTKKAKRGAIDGSSS